MSAAHNLSGRTAWLTVAILFVFSVFAMVDRQIMTMLVDPIRKDLGISDVQISLLIGLSFALFYTTFGLGMGWLADRTSRRNLIAVSVGLWGLASAACGLADSFGELFLARVLVGVGEAALGPAAYSMISDAFPRNKLALPMSVYIMGGLVGGAVAILTGGFVIHWSVTHASVSLPLLGTLSSWRLVFIVTGLPGPLLALLALLVPEPARTGRAIAGAPGASRLGGFLKHHGVLLTGLCIGFGCLSMIVNSTFSWSPTILGRTLHIAPIAIGLIVAALLLFAAVPGQLFSGMWVDRQWSRGKSGIHLRFYVVALPLAAISGALALLSNSPWWFTLGMVPLYFIAMPFLGIASAAIQLFTPNEYRGRVSALFIMVVTLIGFGVGPTLVAALSTSLDASGMQIGTALAIVITGAATLAVVTLGLSLERFRRTLAEAHTQFAVNG